MRFFSTLLSVLLICLINLQAEPAVWQWSVPIDKGRAFLWIPADCSHVRAVVLAQHNMIEQGILEHPILRDELAKQGVAEIWIAPPLDGVFHFDQGASEKFQAVLDGLADVSGYSELKTTPIIPLGHSACASYPWNFAASHPERTLAILSVHGDAPQSNRTGSGKPNPDWGDRNIDGIPGLMVMGEFEWSEDRLTPALDYVAKHPKTPLAMLAEPSSGHYNYSDQLVSFLALFLRKAMAARLVDDKLQPIDPTQGWLVQRWTKNQGRTIPPAPYAQYSGDRRQAFWAFDEETARAIQNYGADQPGKKPQLISVTTDEMPMEKGCGEPVNLKFVPDADGITFHLHAAFMSTVPGDATHNQNAARWSYLPAGSPLGHATGGGLIVITKVVGPAEKIAADTFRVQLDRNYETEDKRNNLIVLVGHHPGDAQYKGIWQQAYLNIVPNLQGAENTITFPKIADQKIGVKSITLNATASSGLPVAYFVREGAATIQGNVLTFTAIPPRSKLPMALTVTAWQWGHAGSDPVQTAPLVSQTFYLTP